MASKFLAVYNGVMLPFDDEYEFAVKIMGFKIEWNEENNDWDVIINGKEVAHYSNEYTLEEIKKNYFRSFFTKNTFSNLHFYKLINSD